MFRSANFCWNYGLWILINYWSQLYRFFFYTPPDFELIFDVWDYHHVCVHMCLYWNCRFFNFLGRGHSSRFDTSSFFFWEQYINIHVYVPGLLDCCISMISVCSEELIVFYKQQIQVNPMAAHVTCTDI